MKPNTISTNDMLIALNPISNKFCPPLIASRLRTKQTPDQLRNKALTHPYGTASSRGQHDNLKDAPGPGNQAAILALNEERLSNEQLIGDRASATSSGQRLCTSKSTPIMLEKHSTGNFDASFSFSTSNDALLTPTEEELMRRSLSRVTLKTRVDRNRAAGAERLKNRGHEALAHSEKREQKEKEDILSCYFNMKSIHYKLKS
ncbi:unnamed protein product [Phytophthora lilii]|uniref:Unnamed protein product n=1 Tax=Phytophthora lilii TaxID=2077276 RepID=A0A9W6UD26_9STRA|nr:unnamed protein product [Phytophthora lilii]